jgi:tetratricopeptide (TPR) repeat protein
MMHRIWALNAQALVSLRQGDNEQALHFLDQARSLPGERPEPQQEMITWAYLGIAYLRLGDWGRARESADQATALMEQVSASAYTHFEAFAAVAEIYMSLWEMKQDSSSAEAEALAGAAREVCESLRRGTVKSGQPSSWLYRGWYSYLDGHPRRAYKHWQKGSGVAGAVGMRYELGRIHFEMGRHAGADDPQREEHLQRAGEIFEEIGAHYYLQRTQVALEHSLKMNQSG